MEIERIAIKIAKVKMELAAIQKAGEQITNQIQPSPASQKKNYNNFYIIARE